MTDENKLIEALEARAVRRDGRRAFFKAALGAAAVGAGGMMVANAVDAAVTVPAEVDILNFALNLEYLEANFYSLAVNGTGISPTLIGATGVPVTNRAVVNFATDAFPDALLSAIAREIAEDEVAHVTYLRQQLGALAVAQPKLDLGEVPSGTTAFSKAAQAAGLVGDGVTFDPYSSIDNFLLGAFLFEDVGVTAYGGALPSITTSATYNDLNGIMSTEASHAGAIRTQMYIRGVSVGGYTAFDTTLPTSAQAISDQRDKLDGGSTELDQGITTKTTDATGLTTTTDPSGVAASNVAALNSGGLGLTRTAGQVLNIVYLNSAVATSGGFFPQGMNGNIKSSTAAA